MIAITPDTLFQIECNTTANMNPIIPPQIRLIKNCREIFAPIFFAITKLAVNEPSISPIMKQAIIVILIKS